MEYENNGSRSWEIMPKVRLSEVNGTLHQDFLNLCKIRSMSMDSLEFAKCLDEDDPLRDFRKLFHYPKKMDVNGVELHNVIDENEDCIYLCGQSLGLQLKSVDSTLRTVLRDWAQTGVECHFKGNLPAASCDSLLKESMAYLVGAEPNEVSFMNGLTVNIHILLSSFYKPTPDRHKILMVANGFHSDMYAVRSHVEFRNYDPEESIIFLKPKEGKHLISHKDILDVIKKEGKNIAVIFLEGVHFYTGQLFHMKDITRAGHEQGCIVGFDLAHAVGNVKLQLHNWNVDFAMWCTYKYLNSGPGSMGAAFCHRQHTQGSDGMLPALRGWWGLNDKRKFAFDKEFTPAEGADRFKMSNASPVLSSMILSNLKVFKEAGIERIQQKQRLLTGYLEYLLKRHLLQNEEDKLTGRPRIEMITPNNPKKRGSQISLMVSTPISKVESILKAKGIVCDVRKPSVIRVTPVPLYNTFTDVYNFVRTFKEALDTLEFNESPEK